MALKTLADLKKAKAPEWIWKGYLSPGALTLLSAYPKVGKTTFLAHMLRAMWTEDEFLSLPIRPRPTMIISEEADTKIAERCAELGYSDMWPIFWQTPEPNKDWSDHLRQMEHFAHLYTSPLIVLDTLSRHWGIDDENDNAKVEKVMGPLIALTRSSGAALCLIHHTRKSGGRGGMASRGGSAIVGAVDIVSELRRMDKDENSRSNKRRLESFSRFGDTPDTLVCQLTDEGYVFEGTEVDETVQASDAVQRWLMRNPGWWKIESIAASMKTPQTTIRAALKVLETEDSIFTKGSGRRGDAKQYGIVIEEEDEVVR